MWARTLLARINVVLSHSASISGHETVSNVIHAVVAETVKSFTSERYEIGQWSHK